jgi:thiamine-monophosphate kinase
MIPDLKGKDYLVGRLLKPEARKDIFEFFTKAQLIPTSMIDVSDGLSSEIMHICKQSGVGALIEEAGIPIAQETFSQALEFNLDPLTCALHGGEDYELLFTLNPKDIDKIKYMLDIKILGEVLPASEGIQLQTKGGKLHTLTAQGWQHY